MAVFDGSTNYLLRTGRVLKVPPADSGKGALSCWFNTEDTTSLIFMGGTSATTAQVSLGLVSGTLRMTVREASTIKWRSATDSTYNDGEWHHVAASWDLDNSLAYIYVDAANDQTDTTAPTSGSSAYSTSTEWSIGAVSNGTSFYTGSLYDLAFWPGLYVDLTDDDELQLLVANDAAADRLKTSPAGVKPVGYGHQGTNLGQAAAILFSDDFRRNYGTGGELTIQAAFSTDDSTHPNPFRLFPRRNTPGVRWFLSEQSGIPYAKTDMTVERREGLTSAGKRIGLDEVDARTRREGPGMNFSDLVLGVDEDDDEDLQR